MTRPLDETALKAAEPKADTITRLSVEIGR
jgi:hypothetical protein